MNGELPPPPSSKVTVGISRTTFIVGLVLSILASSLISMFFARGPQGIQGVQGPQGIQGPSGPSRIPFVSTYNHFVIDTNSTVWEDISTMSVTITLDRPSTLLILFNAELGGYVGFLDEGTRSVTTGLWIRALVNDLPAEPYKGTLAGILSLSMHSGETIDQFSHSCTFWDYVNAGTYIIKIQWQVGLSSAHASADESNLVVIALPTE